MGVKKATLQDVAKLAGVTASTVSRLVNGKTLAVTVTDETRQRVFEAVKTLGYTPNLIARSLSTARTHAIGLCFPITEPPERQVHHEVKWIDLGALVSGVQRVTQARGYEIHIGYRVEHDYMLQKRRQDIRTDFLDGVIYVEPNARYDYYSTLAKSGIPLVTLGANPFDPLGFTVSGDDCAEMAGIVRALAQKGHRRIAYLMCLTNMLPQDCALRIEGYCQGLEESGLAFDSVLLGRDSILDVPAWRQALNLMAEHPAPTALIIGQPFSAREVLESLAGSGIRCPEDVEALIIGDDLSFELYRPSLSAMRMSFFDHGVVAAELLIDIVERKAPAKHHVRVPWRYIERGSCVLGGSFSVREGSQAAHLEAGDKPVRNRKEKGGAGRAKARRIE